MFIMWEGCSKLSAQVLRFDILQKEKDVFDYHNRARLKICTSKTRNDKHF